MAGFDTEFYWAAPGGVVDPAGLGRKPNYRRETVPGFAGWPFGSPVSLPASIDDITRQLSTNAYEAMLTDPAVASSYNTHKMGILAGGLKFVSPVKQPAWSKRPQAPARPSPVSPAGDTPSAHPDRQLSPDQELAREVQQFVEYGFNGIRETFGATLFGLLDAMGFGHKMAEMTFRQIKEGEYQGKLTFESIKVKPNRAWRFVVDDRLNVLGFVTAKEGGGWNVLPADKFLWLSWMPKDGDPRGTSILRAAYNAWNLKIQSWPSYYKFLKRFGSPGLDFELPESVDAGAIYPDIDAVTGLPVPGAPPITASEFYTKLLGVYEAGGTFTHPNGSKLQIAEPNSNGEALLKAFDLFDRQVMLAIEYQTRAALEAKHGSKADGEQAQDRKGLVIDYGRDWLAMGAVYRAAKLLVRLNYGDDAAERLTPMPTFGNTEAQDRPAMWAAAASLGVTVGPSQIEEFCEETGLPIPDAEADAAAAMESMKAMAALKTDTASTQGDGAGKGGKPPAKPKPGKAGNAK